MEADLEQRLTVFEREGLAAPQIVAFVREIVSWLEQEAQCKGDEEHMGPLVSHLLLALERVRRGEELGSAWSPLVQQEASALRTLPHLQDWAEAIREQARQRLGLSLPPEEEDFLLLHLGALLLRGQET
ncbi:PRD domain-containing protein [Thermogemmatispora sp.]|uniref:PRD domain-containing protein n=1 Tax=Thermogemmatispora sp. TaxID=1968838 RepID=UPI001E123F8C|nr:PRD domain-containing protein [Thermogemmatispora sp.]MBX5450352.1 PRD domain-containing protein [Thermogemmatispora sp.]